MRIFGMILITVGAAIIVVFGVLTAGMLPGVDPFKEFIIAVVFGGPLAALGLILVAIRKPEQRTPKA
jgi:hypothetical protein